MGQLVASMLQTLAGNDSNSPVPGAAPSPLGTVPPENGMSEAVMGFPSVPLGNRTVGYGGGPNPDGSMSAMPGGGGQADEMAAVVQGFKPKKISFWGALGDQLLKHWGNQPAFSQNIQNKNMRRAMEGFTNDPLEAIRRISQIPGMEGKAWDMLNTYQDNQRMQGTLDKQNRQLDQRNEDYMNQYIAGMMGAANEGTWGKMRDLAIQRAKARDIDVSHLIPEQYDPDSVEFMRYGAVKPKDQMTLEERRANNEARVALGRDRLGETTRHNQAQEGQAAVNERGRETRHNNPVARPRAEKAGPAQSVLQDGSRIVYGGPDKRTALTAVVILPDGSKRFLNKLPSGKWREVAAPKKEGK